MIHSVSSPLAAFVNRLNRRSQLTQQEQGAILGLPFVKEHFQIHRDIVGLGERVTCASYIERGMVGRFECQETWPISKRLSIPAQARRSKRSLT